MNGTALNKIKSKALGVAGTALSRVELATEEGRLKTKFQSLGQKLYKAVQGEQKKLYAETAAYGQGDRISGIVQAVFPVITSCRTTGKQKKENKNSRDKKFTCHNC